MPSKDSLVRIVAAIAGIVAIGLAAATISSPTEPAGSDGTGPGENGGYQPPPPETTEDATHLEIPTFLEYLVYAIIIIGAVALAWYMITHRREVVKAIAVILVVALIVVGVLTVFYHFAPEIAAEPPAPEQPPQNESANGGGDGPGDPTQDSAPISLGPLLGVLGFLAAVYVGAVLLSGREDEPIGTIDATDEFDPDAEERLAVADAAGRAADRIASTDDVDNEVYRAWKEMTTLLEVDRPESSTPGEFATAAIAAGMEREHVDGLTRLFEEVRYGHEETTEAVEQQAVSILRQIEATYGESEETRSASGTGGERR